ncbi:hypothetical protein KSF73_11175 [Burkholderiaceae bacterium DAT-1]|nr:hypothetical protein [Burkholderiaceae bacterium DAT-1]
MLSRLKQLFQRDDWLPMAHEWLSTVEHQPPLQLIPRLSDWLVQVRLDLRMRKHPAPLFAELLDPLSNQLERVLFSVLDGPPNPVRLSLQVRGVASYAALVREILEELLAQAHSTTLMAAYLEWQAAERMILRVRDGHLDAPDWPALFDNVAPYLNHEVDRLALAYPLAMRVLTEKVLTPDLHSRQPLEAFQLTRVLAECVDVIPSAVPPSPFILGDGAEPGGAWPIRLSYRRVLMLLDEWEHEMQVKHTLPALLDDMHEMPFHEMCTIVQLMSRHLKGTPPARLSDRHDVEASVAWVIGFEQVGERIALSRHFADTSAAGCKRCDVANLSLTGLGLRFPAESDWLKSGELLGIKTDDEKQWRLGVVRRVAADGVDQLLVGLEMLSRAPEEVRVMSPGTSSQWANGPLGDVWTGVNGLYLPPDRLNHQRHLLLMNSDCLKTGMRYGVPGTSQGDMMFVVMEIVEIFAGTVLYRVDRVPGEEVLQGLTLSGTRGWLLE